MPQGETVKYTKKNSDILPFEAGGELRLEQYASKADCGLFLVGNHTKKRPNNLILGRLYDNRLYDLLEMGVESYKSIKSFGAASSVVQTQNKVQPLSQNACAERLIWTSYSFDRDSLCLVA